MEQEIWLPIKYGNGKKEISNWGNVRNSITKRLLKCFINRGGYRAVSFLVDKKNRNCKIHRLVAEHFIPNPENKPQVNHKDLNKLNNHVNNLEWNTSLENITHYFKNGFKGKINDDDVLFIRKNIEQLGCGEIAKILGVNVNYVLSIANGREKANIHTELIRDKKPSLPKEIVRIDANGNVLEEYRSIGEVASAYNTRVSAIQRVLEGERASHKDMFFNYKNEKEKYFVKQIADKKAKKPKRTGILQLSISGDLVNRYKTIREAAASIGVSTASISFSISGRQKTSGGYKWQYA